MLRPLLSYLTIVFLFGSLIGWSNSLNSEYPPLYHFKSAYVIMALIWGSIFFAPIILTLKASKKTKLFAIVSLSFTADFIPLTVIRNKKTGSKPRFVKLFNLCLLETELKACAYSSRREDIGSKPSDIGRVRVTAIKERSNGLIV